MPAPAEGTNVLPKDQSGLSHTGVWDQTLNAGLGGYMDPRGVGGYTATAPSQGTLTNRSGTITAGGVAQTLAAINLARRHFFLQNLDRTNSLWVNFTTTAVASQPSIELTPGAVFSMDSGFVSTELISVIGPLTGQAFAAKEG